MRKRSLRPFAQVLTLRATAWPVLVFALVFSVAGTRPTPALAQGKEIVFLAGPKDHGYPGRHEYEKDLRALATALESSPDFRGLRTRVLVGPAPRDLEELRNAAVLVIHSSSDRLEGEVHPIFPANPTTNGRGYDEETTAYLVALDELIRTGVGVVVFHYATWVENWTARGYYMDWLGGLWVQMASRNPTDEWTMTPKSPEHPVLRGVREWTYRDEVFCRFFLPDDPRRTDLLVGSPARARVGLQVAAWAYEREDGGRSFVMGGVDFHDNIYGVADYRRFLLNGIVWAAGMEVPEKGMRSTLRPPAASE
jgi:type 1 glutamine amidotransferase